MRTALRVLLVAAIDGHVNEFELEERYGVGGESRHRVLAFLYGLKLLSRSKAASERGKWKYVYRLSDKGVLLCTAFSCIEPNRFVAMIRNHVKYEALANTSLVLFHHRTAAAKNGLITALRCASDMSLNFETTSEEALAERLFHAEDMMLQDQQATFLFRLLQNFVDFYSDPGAEKLIAPSLQGISDFLSLARSEPLMTKRFLTAFREAIQFWRSSDFQVWVRSSPNLHKDLNRLKQIVFETIRNRVGEIESLGFSDRLEVLWKSRRAVLDDVRRKLRDESASRLSGLYPKLEVA